MKSTIFIRAIVAFAYGIAPCSSEVTTEAAGEENMADMNMYGAQMDRVDAIYQAALTGE
ncbi:MAG: hypothetical protein ACI8TS_000294 [Flavobacteriales bacterium]|jgi:hypothetical protein